MDKDKLMAALATGELETSGTGQSYDYQDCLIKIDDCKVLYKRDALELKIDHPFINSVKGDSDVPFIWFKLSVYDDKKNLIGVKEEAANLLTKKGKLAIYPSFGDTPAALLHDIMTACRDFSAKQAVLFEEGWTKKIPTIFVGLGFKIKVKQINNWLLLQTSYQKKKDIEYLQNSILNAKEQKETEVSPDDLPF